MRWPRDVCGAQVVMIDGPPLRYMGLYETREPHDRWLVRRLRHMLLGTLRMAAYQRRVTGLAPSTLSLNPIVPRTPSTFPGRGPKGSEGTSPSTSASDRSAVRLGAGGSGCGPSPRDLPAKRRPVRGTWRAKGPHP